MEKVLQGMPGVVVYILVTGKTDDEHLQNLDRVLERLLEHGLRLKKKKCQLMKTFRGLPELCCRCRRLAPCAQKGVKAIT